MRNIIFATVLVLIIPVTGIFAQHQDWMTKNKSHINSKTLREIIWPGSHDAGTGVFQQPYQVANETGDAEVTTTLYNQMKGVLGSAINGRIANMARTQNRSVYEQLKSGARYFDLRPYWNNGDVSNSHTLVVQKMASVFDDIEAFLERYPNEVIILHERQEGGFNSTRYNMYWSMVMKKLGHRLVPNNYSAKNTYADIINSGRRVIYVTSYDRPSQTYLWPKSKINGNAGWPGNGVTGTNFYNKVKDHLAYFARTTDVFIVASLAYTPVWTEYTASVTTGGSLKQYHDQHIRNQIVSNLDNWYQQAGGGMNILMTDFIEDNPTFVQKVIDLNKKSTAPSVVPFAINFKNTAPYDTWFEVVYKTKGQIQKWNTGTLGNGGTKSMRGSDDRLIIISVRAMYKDGLTWKDIETKTYNKDAKSAPKNFSLSGKLFQQPSFGAK